MMGVEIDAALSPHLDHLFSLREHLGPERSECRCPSESPVMCHVFLKWLFVLSHVSYVDLITTHCIGTHIQHSQIQIQNTNVLKCFSFSVISFISITTIIITTINKYDGCPLEEQRSVRRGVGENKEINKI